MTSGDARARHKELCDQIRLHNYYYHELKQPSVSDQAYDTLVREKQDLEAQFPEFSAPEPFQLPDTSKPACELTDAELLERQEKFRFMKKKDFAQLIEDEALQRPAHAGFIYILSNPAFPALVKIGITSGPVEKRLKELSRATGVPEPFKVEFYLPLYVDLVGAEDKVHAALDLYRPDRRREFFRLSAMQARSMIEDILGAKMRRPQPPRR